jgi:hypothetical protein
MKSCEILLISLPIDSHLPLAEVRLYLYPWAVPWLRRLAAGLPPRRPGFDPGSVHVGFVVDKVALGRVFPPNSSVLPCQFRSTGAPLLRKG